MLSCHFMKCWWYFLRSHKWVVLLIFFFLFAPYAHAQLLAKIFKKDSIDNNYYEANDTLTNTRLYASQKLTYPTLKSGDGNHEVRYRSNGNTNLGFGNTYGWLTVNIGLNFKFINDDDHLKGKTDFIDMHTQIVGRPYVVDFYGQFYKGVYLMPETGDLPKGTPYPLRPDIYTQQIGFSSYFIPNWRKFSYAAAVTQRDWQKKSAGSFLFGGEFFAGKIKGDSALVPKERARQFENPGINKVKYYEIGFGAGYAYTLVIKRHWFVSASAVTGIATGFLQQYERYDIESSMYFRPNFMIRPSFGYNSKKFNGAVYLFSSQVNAGNTKGYYQVNTSNLRVTIAYRFAPSQRIKKRYQALLNLNPYYRKQQKSSEQE